MANPRGGYDPYNYEKRGTYVADAVRDGAITEFEHRLMNAITCEENAARREGRECQATPEELKKAHRIMTRTYAHSDAKNKARKELVNA